MADKVISKAPVTLRKESCDSASEPSSENESVKIPISLSFFAV